MTFDIDSIVVLVFSNFVHYFLNSSNQSCQFQIIVMFWVTSDLSTFSFLSFLFWFFSWVVVSTWYWSFCLCWSLLRWCSYLALVVFWCLWSCYGFQWLSGAYSSFCPWAPLGPLRSTTCSCRLDGLRTIQLSHTSFGCLYSLMLYLLILHYVSLPTCWVWGLILEIGA